MPIDGFQPEQRDVFSAFDAQTAARFYSKLRTVSRWFDIEVSGLARVPSGRALIVANHAFGWDIALAMSAVWHDLHRTVWVLGDHVWWKVPFLRSLASRVGTVDGTPANVDQLLTRDELVLVLPGGVREAVKPRELRYRLLWGHRYGFIRAAIRNQTPIVPLAAIGADDWFDFVGNAYSRGARWLHRPDIPLPLPSRILPIPHRAPLRYVFGEPIFPRLPREAERDESAVRQLRREVGGALHEIIDNELARRAGIDTN